MVNVAHSTLTGADLHEPKGVSGASSGTVYTADGAGSGTWTSPTATINNLNTFYMNGVIADISTASSDYYFRLPAACVLTDVYFVLDGAITVADAIIKLYIDGVLQAQTKTIAYSGSGAGIKYTLNLSPTYAITAGQVLKVESDGASTTAARCFITCKFTAS